MEADPVSPVALARLRALLVPIGRMKASDFGCYVEALKSEPCIRLGDVSPDGRSDSNLFSPLAFPNGLVLLNFVTSASQEDKSDILLFDTFRAPLLAIGICQEQDLHNFIDQHEAGDSSANKVASAVRAFDQQCAETLRARVPAAIATSTVVFGVRNDLKTHELRGSLMFLPSTDAMRRTTIKTLMCDIISNLLAEMASYAKIIQDMPSIDVQSTTRFVSAGPMLHVSESSRPSSSRPATADGFIAQTSPRNSGTATPNDDEPGSAESSRPASPAVRVSTSSRPANIASIIEADTQSTSSNARNMSDSASNRPSTRKGKESASDSANNAERARSRVKARQVIILGALQLHAGRWPDALKELVDGANRARIYNDFVWYGKALELILSTMILLAWARFDFIIPPVCYPASEMKQPGKDIPSFGFMRGSDPTEVTDETYNKLLQSLSRLIPDFVQMIASAYSKASADLTLHLAQASFSDAIVRLGFLLVALARSNDSLDHRTLTSLVRGTTLVRADGRAVTTAPSQSHKRFISSFVFQAYPVEPVVQELPIHDTIRIFTGMATVLSLAQLHRKKAMIMRELLAMLIPKLIQARKIGAAEAGIHPAASLAALHGLSEDGGGSFSVQWGEFERSMHRILLALCRSYGLWSSGRYGAPGLSLPELRKEYEKALTEECDLRENGGFSLKAESLRLCANFSEALPNFKDVIDFSAAILKFGNPGLFPVGSNLQQKYLLYRDEQVRCVSKINRTLSAVKVSDVSKLETAYWDPFIVRGATLQSSGSSSTLIVSQKPSDIINSQTITDEGAVFIHRPMRKVMNETTEQDLIAEGPSFTIVITLQNPCDFELAVESLKLRTSGVEFSHKPQSLMLRPCSFQDVEIKGVVPGPGKLLLEGCTIKLQGCSEQDFLIFPNSWLFPDSGKVKSSLGPKPSHTDTTGLDSSKEAQDTEPADLPVPKQYSITVVHEQPKLVATRNALSQSTQFLLEGEESIFEIELENTSSVPANFVNVSFLSQTKMTANAADSKYQEQEETPDADTKSILAPAWSDKESQASIDSNSTCTFRIKIKTRDSSTHSAVRFDYGFVSAEQAAKDDKIYTRSLLFPVELKVQSAVSLARYNILSPQSHALTYSKLAIDNANVGNGGHAASGSKHETHDYDGPSTRTEFIAMELFNARSQTVDVVFDILADGTNTKQPHSNGTIEARHTAEFLIPLPSLPAGTNNVAREHVAEQDHERSAEKRDEVAEPQISISDIISASWRDTSTGRTGSIDLSDIVVATVSSRSQHKSADLELKLVPSNGSYSDLENLSADTFKALPQTVLCATVTLRNDSEKHIRPRIKTTVEQLGHGVWDGEAILWNSTRHKTFPSMSPGTVKRASFAFTAMTPGHFLVSSSAELLEPYGSKETKATALADTDTMRAIADILRSSATLIVGES